MSTQLTDNLSLWVYVCTKTTWDRKHANDYV